MSIHQIISQLAATSSRLEKEAILRANSENDLLKSVIKLALDPFIQFYIRKIPKYKASKVTLTLAGALDKLGELSSRNKTGNAGIEHLTYIMESVNAEDALVIERVIEKDLRCGVSEATVNKIWPRFIPTYPVMLASGFEGKLIEKFNWPGFVQLKLDGMRFNAIVRNGKVELRSRNGKELNIPNELFHQSFTELAKLYQEDVVFDGELLVINESGKPLDRKTGNGILTKSIKGTQSKAEAAMVRATLWDAIPFNAFVEGVFDTPYHKRLKSLTTSLTNVPQNLSHLLSIVETKEVENQYQATELFNKYLQLGFEGTILKDRNGIWEDKRSKGQIKFKGELECDLKVVDWEEGTGKNKGRLGNLVVESSDGVIRVGVGTGFTDLDRDTIKPNVVGKIVSIKYNARIQDKRGNVESLFLPVFVEIREDKTLADSSLEIK
jgi:ATP-dependent DNA ligase